MLHVEAQWWAKATIVSAEGVAVWCEKRHLAREGAQGTEDCCKCCLPQAEGVKGFPQLDRDDVGQGRQKAVDFRCRKVVRHIDHKTTIRAGATNTLEICLERTIAEAAAIERLKALGVSH
jgi:hypothetical protein